MQLAADVTPGLFDDLQNAHFGFRPQHSMIEELSVLTCAVERAREFGLPLVLLKCDVKKVFDRVRHETILEALEFHKIHPTSVLAFARE